MLNYALANMCNWNYIYWIIPFPISKVPQNVWVIMLKKKWLQLGGFTAVAITSFQWEATMFTKKEHFQVPTAVDPVSQS